MRAIATVLRFVRSVEDGNCNAFFATTTSTFRVSIGVSDCDALAAASADFTASNQDYEATVTATEKVGRGIQVITTETYTSRFDELGNETADAQPYEDRYLYVVIATGSKCAVSERSGTPQHTVSDRAHPARPA